LIREFARGEKARPQGSIYSRKKHIALASMLYRRLSEKPRTPKKPKKNLILGYPHATVTGGTRGQCR
jgi:hypothetical protein